MKSVVHVGLQSGHEFLWSYGVGCADQDQVRDRPHPHLQTFVQRRHLWLLCDEHRWNEPAGLSLQDRHDQDHQDLPSATHVCCEGSGTRYDQLLRTVQVS